MGSYFGSIVLARSERPITTEPAIEQFGIHHMWLRDLGDGWQLLETSHPDIKQFDYAAAAHNWCESTGTPVLAIYVSGGDCAAVLAAAPGADDVMVHLPDPTQECTVYEHPYRTRTMPSADAVGAVATWARTAGLAPDETGLSWLMDTDPQTETEASYLPADDHAFELVLALGIPSITPSRSPMLDPTEPPYSTITDRMGGLAAIARIELVHGSTTNSPDTWVLDAIDLDRRIWRAAFNEVDNIDIPELVGEIARLVVAHQDDRNKAGPPAATVTIGGRSVVTAQHLAETTRQMLSTQQVFRRPRHDRRPANHPVRRRHAHHLS